MRYAKVLQAVTELQSLIDGGTEYPTAHETVCSSLNLTTDEAEQVTADYDRMCAIASYVRTPR